MRGDGETLVTWERWEQTFHHPVCPMGKYFPRSRGFASREAARGFAEGLKSDASNRQVRLS